MNADAHTDSPVRWERRDAVGVVTLAREERLNALSRGLVDAVIAALDELERDPEIRSAVLCGDGRAFSAGGDLADVAAAVADGEAWTRLDYLRRQQALVTRIRESRLPVVAAVSGLAYGAGWSTVLACDLVVATADARFCQVFVKRDLVPDLGSAWLLPRAVGALMAKELMLLGDEISAQRALELGLVNRLAETAEDAEREALGLASRLCETVPATMAMTKSLINGSQQVGLGESLRLEEHAQSITLGTPETLGALRAFLEKRAGKATASVNSDEAS